MIGHVLCVYADRLLLCTPGGQFGFSDMKDNARMAKIFEAKPESETLQSIVLGSLAMFLQFFGYLALGIWMRQYSAFWANLMIVGAAMIYTFGLAHHILGCSAEWIYIKSGHTEEGWKLTNDFFGKTSATMIGCYAGILLVMFVYALLKNHPSTQTAFSIFAMEYYGLVLPLSVAFFLFVKEWQIDRPSLRNVILAVAPLSFAVYIIHTQPVVDAWLWDVASRWLESSQPGLLPLVCIAITLLVFLGCIVVEYVRHRLASACRRAG